MSFWKDLIYFKNYNMSKKIIKWVIICGIIFLIIMIFYFWHQNALKDQKIKTLTDDKNIIEVADKDQDSLANDSSNIIKPQVLPAEKDIDADVKDDNQSEMTEKSEINNQSGRLWKVKNVNDENVVQTNNIIWQKYKNDKFGIEFDYTSDFVIKDEDEFKASFISKQSKEFWCGKLINTACSAPHFEVEKIINKSIDEYIADANSQGENNVNIKSNLVIDDKQTAKIDFSDLEIGEGYLIQNGDDLIIISGGSLNPKGEFKIDEIINF
jgi:hypothetical protein